MCRDHLEPLLVPTSISLDWTPMWCVLVCFHFFVVSAFMSALMFSGLKRPTHSPKRAKKKRKPKLQNEYAYSVSPRLPGASTVHTTVYDTEMPAPHTQDIRAGHPLHSQHEVGASPRPVAPPVHDSVTLPQVHSMTPAPQEGKWKYGGNHPVGVHGYSHADQMVATAGQLQPIPITGISNWLNLHGATDYEQSAGAPPPKGRWAEPPHYPSSVKGRQ